jgi:hypothetical protein
MAATRAKEDRALPDPISDVHQTLAFGRQKLNRRFLLLGLICVGLGIMLALVKDRFTLGEIVMTTFTIGLGVVICLYALIGLVAPGKPMLVLSRSGIRLNVEWVKDIDIPWREVRAIETADVSGKLRGDTVTFTGVTTVLVSRAFYNRRIHIASWLLRGPGWHFNFIPRGDMVQVALHHEVLPIEKEELRAAVEMRWRAFRDADPTSVPQVLPDEP